MVDSEGVLGRGAFASDVALSAGRGSVSSSDPAKKSALLLIDMSASQQYCVGVALMIEVMLALFALVWSALCRAILTNSTYDF